MTFEDRRRHSRVKIRLTIDGNPVGQGATRDISVSGMYIDLDKPSTSAVAVGDSIDLSFRIPVNDDLSLIGGALIRTEALIVHVRPSDDEGILGLGVEFQNLSTYHFWAIEECVNQLLARG